MLYLLRDNRGPKVLIKVGITKNINRRLAQYRTCNPCAKLIELVDIDIDSFLEKDLHKKYEKEGYKRIKGTEWFEVPKQYKKTKSYLITEMIKKYYRVD